MSGVQNLMVHHMDICFQWHHMEKTDQSGKTFVGRWVEWKDLLHPSSSLYPRIKRSTETSWLQNAWLHWLDDLWAYVCPAKNGTPPQKTEKLLPVFGVFQLHHLFQSPNALHARNPNIRRLARLPGSTGLLKV